MDLFFSFFTKMINSWWCDMPMLWRKFVVIYLSEREEWRVMAGRLTGLLQHSGASEGLRAGQAALIITTLLRYHIHADCHSTYWKYFIQDHSTAPGWRSGRRIMVLSKMFTTCDIKKWWNGWKMLRERSGGSWQTRCTPPQSSRGRGTTSM